MSSVFEAAAIAGLAAVAIYFVVTWLLLRSAARRRGESDSQLSVLVLPGVVGLGGASLGGVALVLTMFTPGAPFVSPPPVPPPSVVIRTSDTEPAGPVWRSTVRSPEDGRAMKQVNQDQPFDLRIRFAYRPAECHVGVQTPTGPRLDEIIKKGVTVRLVLVADPEFIEVIDTDRSKPLLLSTDVPDDPCTPSEADDKPPVTQAAATFHLKTRKRTGNGRIVVAIYQGGRPMDEIAVQVCIACRGTDPIRSAAAELSDSANDMLNAADDAPVTDASLYFFDFANGASAGVLAVRGTSSEFSYSPWANVAETVQSIRGSLENIAPGLSNATTDEQLAAKSVELTNVLFPPGPASSARDALEKLLLDAHNDKKPPPSLFVRVASLDNREPIVVPIGLVRLRDDANGARYLGRYATVVMPLKIQSYRPSDDCTEQMMGVMPTRDGANGALALAREAMGSTAARWESAAGEFEWSSTAKFARWLASAPRVGKSTALFFLTHHFNDSIWINDSEPVNSNAMQSVQFLQPSWAVLNGCGTDQSRVSGDGFAKRLNAAGMQAVIATHSEVPASLAGSYFACMDRALARTGSNGRLGSVHFAATECLWNEPIDSSANSPTWKANALKYTLLGNPNLKVCAIKQRAPR